MAEVKDPPVPAQRPRGLKQTLWTSQPTEEGTRALLRALAVELGRTPTQDEVIAACVMIGSLHMPLLVQYVKERTP